MAGALFQAQTIEQFVCGTPLRERQRQAHLLDTRLGSCPWNSRQMASALSQARTIELFVYGTPRRDSERQRQARLLDTWIRSCLWHSLQMASASSPQGYSIDQFVCPMPVQYA